jgi:predicted unusual protein kinase regulating ubiquinone biosynthesis (AarF/ABC1/UbiB family)
MARWLCLKEGAVKTDQGTVCMRRYDVVTLDEDEVPKEHIEAGYIKPLNEARKEFYSDYMEILNAFELVQSEIKRESPKFFEYVQEAINRIEEGFIKEDYHLVNEALQYLKALYLRAMRGQY